MSLWLLLALGVLTTLTLGIGIINSIFPSGPPPLEKGRGDRAGCPTSNVSPVGRSKGGKMGHG